MKSPVRKTAVVFATLTLMILAAWLIRDRFREKGAGKPNVILVVIDALRADHLGRYGYHRETDAGLEFFTSHSTRFENAYAPSSWTKPSTASIHSGLHPIRHGAREFNSKMPSNVHTISKALKAGGWKTGGFSFNHHVSSKTGFNLGFNAFDSFLGKAVFYPDITEMLERARAWVKGVARKPFFLYLHPMNVHGPYKVPAENKADLLGRPPAEGFVYTEGWMRDIMTNGEIEKREAVPQEYLASLVDQYDTAVRYSTDRLGEFFDWLDARDLYRNSLIIVTSDHGEELFDHGGFSHGYTLHEEVLHVPLYIKLPFQSRRKDVAARASLVDIYPTISDFFDLPSPYEVDGRSLLDLVQDDRVPPPRGERELLFEIDWPERCVATALLGAEFKLVSVLSDYAGRTGETLLYDFMNDPGETRNICLSRAEKAEALDKRRDDLIREMKDNAVGKSGKVARDLDLERLKSLGYVAPKK
jgi:arylsulfatase A-like enzyme